MEEMPTFADGPPPQLGRYLIEERLGSGAFATVYRATDPALDSPVAVKVLADHHSADPELRERFIREARTLRKAARRHLVTIHDIGEEGGRPYLVMEYAAGGTLGDRLGERGPLSPTEAVRLIDQLEQCLADLRSEGVVHRDIKPSNVMIRSPGPPRDGVLGSDEELVLGDFGLARAVDASALTMAGGTLGFMAPEQRIPGSTVDERVDIFAATVVVSVALTGLAPEAAVRELSRRRTQLGAAIRRGTAEHPNARPRSAREWADGLRVALSTSELRPSWRVGIVAVSTAIALLLGGIWLLREPGPVIDGPLRIHPGESVVYSVDDPGTGEYYWTDWTGRTHETPGLRITADDVGRLPLKLTRVVEGTERSTTIEIAVVEDDE